MPGVVPVCTVSERCDPAPPAQAAGGRRWRTFGRGIARLVVAFLALWAADAVVASSATAVVGQTVILSVIFNSSWGIWYTYQWRKDGVDIADAIYSTYTLSKVQLADAANYTVLVGDTWGSTVSDNAALSVVQVFSFPTGVAKDSAGNLFVTDASSNSVQKITPDGIVSPFAGSMGVAGTNDGTGAAARFNQPNGIAIDGADNLYVADTGNALIRMITPAGAVTTLAGSAANRGNRDGVGTGAWFTKPMGIAADRNGNLYVADALAETIRRITPDGSVVTLAGTAGTSGDADGASATFSYPAGVAVDGAGNVYVADAYNNTIREITVAGLVTTRAGSAGISGSNDGIGIYALFNMPTGVAVDSRGNVYVADSANATVRMMDPTGAVTTIAGVAGVAGKGEVYGAPALFNQPSSVMVDNAGLIYVVDSGNDAVREIDANGTVSTVFLQTIPGTYANMAVPAIGGGLAGNTTGSGSAGGSSGGSTGGGGGGGGAMGYWFVLMLATLGSARTISRLRRGIVGGRWE